MWTPDCCCSINFPVLLSQSVFLVWWPCYSKCKLHKQKNPKKPTYPIFFIYVMPTKQFSLFGPMLQNFFLLWLCYQISTKYPKNLKIHNFQLTIHTNSRNVTLQTGFGSRPSVNQFFHKFRLFTLLKIIGCVIVSTWFDLISL